MPPSGGICSCAHCACGPQTQKQCCGSTAIRTARTWNRSTSAGLTDVSSCSSRAAALPRGSLSSTKPPGSAHWPCGSVATAAGPVLTPEWHFCPCGSGCGICSRHALLTGCWRGCGELTLQGGCLRCISRICEGPASVALLTMTVSTVRAGRGHLLWAAQQLVSNTACTHVVTAAAAVHCSTHWYV